MVNNRKVLILTTDEDFSDFQLDLGDIPPAIAYAMLKSATDFLFSMLPNPIVKSYGEVILHPYEGYEEYEEDDDLEN